MDEDGYVYIVDRTKDMLLCGGFNVYPRNIEEAIYQHPSVEEVSVIGVPDAYRGETPKAFVKLKAGAAPLTLDDLKAFLKDRLGKHEMIGALEIRDELAEDAGRQDLEEGFARSGGARPFRGLTAGAAWPCWRCRPVNSLSQAPSLIVTAELDPTQLPPSGMDALVLNLTRHLARAAATGRRKKSPTR